MNIRVNDFFLIKKLGSGSFGDVYLSCMILNNGKQKHVAAKVEDVTKSNKLQTEYEIYDNLRNSGFCRGIPKIYSFIETPKNKILLMQLLDNNLEELFDFYNRQFPMAIIKLIGVQLIKLIKQLHELHYIHRDIKPNNFLLKNNKKLDIHMLDFGLAKKYIIDGKHIKMIDGRSLIGTARYASINVHNGIEPSRRDDLESIGYMLVYFAKSKLPWQNLNKKKGISNINVIGNKKRNTKIEDLCSGLPTFFYQYIKYCRQLQYDDKPNYDYLLKIIQL